MSSLVSRMAKLFEPNSAAGRREFPEMRGMVPVAREQRKLAVILAADIVGYLFHAMLLSNSGQTRIALEADICAQ